jgi:integrase
MVLLAVTTGLRVSELLALRWSDCDFDNEQINLSRGIVRQRIGEMKTESSRRPIPLTPALAEILTTWRSRCPYNQDGDYLFASPAKDGRQPYWPNTIMLKRIRPAALAVGITRPIGWHTFRHSFGTIVKSQGSDVATTQALMRHANVAITMDRYVVAMTLAKLGAQTAIVNLLGPNGAAASQKGAIIN